MTFNNTPRASSDQVDEHGLDETSVDTLRAIYEDLFDPAETISLAGLKPHERLCALRNTALVRKIAIVRQNKHVDCALAIYDLVAALSDNQYGRATVSIPCIAEVMNRSVPRTEEAVRKLVKLGLIERTSEPGKGAHTSLVISRACTEKKPHELVKLLAPKRYRGWKAPTQNEGGEQLPPRAERGGRGAEPPSHHVGGSADTPHGHSHYPPRQVGEPPSSGFSQRVEISREAERNTAISNTAKKNSADYVDAASVAIWPELVSERSQTEGLTDAEYELAVRRYTASHEPLDWLAPSIDPDFKLLAPMMVVNKLLCPGLPDLLGQIIAKFPKSTGSALAATIREEIAFWELCISEFRDVLRVAEALPPASLPALSEAGRKLKIADPLIGALRAGDTTLVYLRLRAEEAFVEALQRAWSIIEQREFTKADVSTFYNPNTLHLPEPPWPASETELASYVNSVNEAVAPSVRAHAFHCLKNCWDDRREEAGLAFSLELPADIAAELDRRLLSWVDSQRPCDDVKQIYWPIIPPSPELEQCVDD